jgi:hypothetical protein
LQTKYRAGTSELIEQPFDFSVKALYSSEKQVELLQTELDTFGIKIKVESGFEL